MYNNFNMAGTGEEQLANDFDVNRINEKAKILPNEINRGGTNYINFFRTSNNLKFVTA